jgi:glutaredoxin
MNKLTVFYLEGCPYCRSAVRAVRELEKELPAFSADRIDWIEERRNADIADRYDYYHVPSVFYQGRKLYECSPSDDDAVIKAQMKRAVETMLFS